VVFVCPQLYIPPMEISKIEDADRLPPSEIRSLTFTIWNPATEYVKQRPADPAIASANAHHEGGFRNVLSLTMDAQEVSQLVHTF
jgi:hypothetical protein